MNKRQAHARLQRCAAAARVRQRGKALSGPNEGLTSSFGLGRSAPAQQKTLQPAQGEQKNNFLTSPHLTTTDAQPKLL